jgi:membrane-associated phospholipid phosphatase
MLTAAATDKDRFRIREWLMFADYGARARRNMAVVWSCVAALALVESIWLPLSRLTFDQAAWPTLAHSLIYVAAAYAFYVAVAYRLRGNQDRAAVLLRAALERFALLFRSCIAIFAIGSVGLVFTYLATAAALPLRDAFLADLDTHLGFNWLGFLGAVNDHPLLPRLLEKAYASTAPLTEGVIVWLTIRGSGERLSEFLGLLCVASLGLAVGMVLVPAAGAFVYFAPAQHLFDNFAGQGEMWPFLDAFNALRDGSLTKIDVSSVQGVVSFPSFHTMLGILITYALRDTKPLFMAVAAINAVMIVSTLPVGGHYLADVIVGAAICAAAIYGMRREFPGSLLGLARHARASRGHPRLLASEARRGWPGRP